MACCCGYRGGPTGRAGRGGRSRWRLHDPFPRKRVSTAADSGPGAADSPWPGPVSREPARRACPDYPWPEHDHENVRPLWGPNCFALRKVFVIMTWPARLAPCSAATGAPGASLVPGVSGTGSGPRPAHTRDGRARPRRFSFCKRHRAVTRRWPETLTSTRDLARDDDLPRRPHGTRSPGAARPGEGAMAWPRKVSRYAESGRRRYPSSQPTAASMAGNLAGTGPRPVVMLSLVTRIERVPSGRATVSRADAGGGMSGSATVNPSA